MLDIIRPGVEVSGTEVKGYLVKDLNVELDGTVTGVAIGGQTSFELNRNRDTKQIGHKDCEGGFAKTFASQATWDFSMDGMYIFNDEGYDILEEAMASKEGKIGLYVDMGNVRYIGTVILTSNNLSFPYDDQMTYSIAGTGSGELKKVDVVEPVPPEGGAKGEARSTIQIKNIVK